MQKTIYIILGKSLSGKSYLQKQLINLDICPIITATTRPKREYEQNGKDYHFVTQKQYLKAEKQNEVISPRCYQVSSNDTWYYYVPKQELKRSQAHLSLVLDVKGLLDFLTYIKRFALPITVKPIYLDIPLDIRLKRYLNTPRRSENEHEFIRRLYDDEMHAFKEMNNLVFRQKYHIQCCTSEKDALNYIRKEITK